MHNTEKTGIIWGCIFLFLITFGVFSGVLDNQFLNEWDDGWYVTYNGFVSTGFSYPNIISAFSVPVVMNWHPVTMLSHMLDVQLFGLNPMYHHLTNLIIHCLNTILVYVFFINSTKNQKASFFVALIFGIHPLHVESVAWLAERKDVLSSFFILGALNLYSRYITSLRTLNLYQHFTLIALFLLGLMSKTMVITFPFLLLLVDYWPLERFENNKFKSLIYEKLPMMLLSGVFVLVTLSTQKSNIYNFKDALYNTLYGLKMYLYKFFIPHEMSYFYDFKEKYSDFSFSVHLLVFLFFIAVLLSFRTKIIHQNKYVLFGIAWFSISILPVSGIVTFGYQSHADRYMYLPIIGFITIICFYVNRHAKPLVYMMLPLIVFWAYTTIIYEKTWNNEYTLYTNKLKYSPDNLKTNFRLGNYYLDKNSYLSAQYFRKVIYADERLRVTTDIKFLKEANLGLGKLCYTGKNYKEALLWLTNFFEYDLEANTQYSQAFDMLNGIYTNIGQNDKAQRVSELGFLYKKVLANQNKNDLKKIQMRLSEILLN